MRLGDDDFDVGEVDAWPRASSATAPCCSTTSSSAARADIFVQHLGSDPTTGGSRSRRGPGSPRECTLVWHASADRSPTPAPRRQCRADGGELPHYPTRVTDGALVIDLSPGGLPGQGPSTTSTSTTILVTGRLTTTTAG